MSTPPLKTPTPSVSTSGSFATRIDFNTLFAAVSQRGVTLNDDEKATVESITRDELKSHDGGSLVGTNPGASGVNLVYVLFSFLQNLLSGKADGLKDIFSSSVENSAEQGKLHELELATQNIYLRLQETKNPHLMAAAELITGQTTVKPKAEHVEGNVYNQILATLDPSKLPANLSTSLNQTELAASISADNAPSSGLPPMAKPLTNTGRGA